ncbi:hypothetical protein RND71_017084 [Anisodus tanguticus]|uniref:Anoctamin transmembrane domain-containing protein n=1 Tax=Anisodus tanguticus TaxID=243964 RepID=A0AAE1S1L2_9SOLA|nr:hypothetical protein RND71_017084 [Anisodus tanguticus]
MPESSQHRFLHLILHRVHSHFTSDIIISNHISPCMPTHPSQHPHLRNFHLVVAPVAELALQILCLGPTQPEPFTLQSLSLSPNLQLGVHSAAIGSAIKNSWPGCSRVAVVETDSYRLLLISERTILVSGVDLQFHWDEVEAYERQPDGSLFSWFERYCCYRHIIYGIVNTSNSTVILKSDGNKVHWEPGEPLLRKLESVGIVKEVFPVHDEKKRKQLLRSWALNWWDFTAQPIDDICNYYETKIASYFVFLGMYTRWMLFPAAFGLTVQLVDFGSLQLFVLSSLFISIISWAVLFFQFWKRKNSALLVSYLDSRLFICISLPGVQVQMNYPAGADNGSISEGEWYHFHSPVELMKKQGADKPDKPREKEAFQREEWLGHFMRFRNDAMIILSIICLQLPFELAFAHVYEGLPETGVLPNKVELRSVYILPSPDPRCGISLGFRYPGYFNKIGGKISVKLVKYENNKNIERRADSWVYKVLENMLENSLPYLKYSFKKYRAVGNKRKRENGTSSEKTQYMSRVEKEYLKPDYSARIGEELEDGLFDDFLELALQFGMIMMFACAFPLGFAFATLNNITEIRTDALKLLAILRRPIPRPDASIGAWLNIFQFLIVMSICTNCILLVCLYDHEGKWKISPGLAAILIMEHVLLLIKFVFSRIVPEEPAWIRTNRMKNATHVHDMCSRQLLRSISSEKMHAELKKD